MQRALAARKNVGIKDISVRFRCERQPGLFLFAHQLVVFVDARSPGRQRLATAAAFARAVGSLSVWQQTFQVAGPGYDESIKSGAQRLRVRL